MKWTIIHRVRRYTLATIRNPTRMRNTTYRVVTGISFKPPAVAGQKVKYRLRADVRHAPWSRVVSITARARLKRAGAPPATARPVTTSAPTTQKLTISVNNTTGWGVDAIYKAAGVTATRLDIGEGDGIGILKTAIVDGMHPLPVYTQGSDGNLNGLTPAQCATDMRTIAPQLQAMGITELEFGNESYLTESAATYAAQYNAAHIAVAGSGVKLLAAATTDQYEADRGGHGSWFQDLIQALPGGAGEIDALTLHPYGSMTSVGSDGFGWPMVATLHAEAVAAGISPTLPWYITEIGQEISGRGLEAQAPVGEGVQATDLTQYLNDIKTKFPWIVYLNWYAARDDSSGGFGLINSDDSPRPAFTALQTWISANSSSTNG